MGPVQMRIRTRGNAQAAEASGIVTSSWVKTESGLANIGLAERIDVLSVDDGFIVEAVYNDATTCVVWRGRDEARGWEFVDALAERMALHEIRMMAGG